jgi:rod shape-determining protein MreC
LPRKEATRRWLVVAGLLIVSLVLLTVFLREPASGSLHAVQQDGVGVLSPLQGLASRAAQPFQDGYRWTKELFAAKTKNKEMAKELERLQGQVVSLAEASQENRRLKGLLQIHDGVSFPSGTAFVVARVIGKSPTKWQEWVQIDKGSDDGVRLNQGVVGATVPADPSLSGKGLVGKVVAVSAHAAQVQLITDPESSVAAIVQGTRAEGILEGSVAGKLIMDFVERDQPVEEKRIVITSGFSRGSVYPKGIPVGVVESVGAEDVNIYKQIEIRPFVDFRTLEEVMVLLTPQALQDEPMLSVAPPVTASTTAATTTTTSGAQ